MYGNDYVMKLEGPALCLCMQDDNGKYPVSTDALEYLNLVKDFTSILIIDDEETVRRSLKRVLKTCADEVYTAGNQKEAKLVLDQHPVSFLICDFDLGRCEPTGTALAECLRKKYPTIERAIIFSGCDPQAIPKSHAIDHVLSKGQDLARLKELLCC